MCDSPPDVPSSEASPQKEPSVSSTLGDTPPDRTDGHLIRAQELLHLISLVPSSFSSQEKVEAAIAVYEAATRLERAQESRETIIQRQLNLMTGDFQHMKEETACRLLSLDSKLDRILGAIEENSEKAEKKTQATDSEAQQTVAKIEELQAEVARIVQQIKDLAILINKMGSKADARMPPSQARSIPRSFPREEPWQTRTTQRRFSPSSVCPSEYSGEKYMEEEPSPESSREASPPTEDWEPRVPFSSGRYIQASARDAPARRSKTFRDDVQKEVVHELDSDYWEWEDAFPISKNRKRSGKSGKRAKKGFVPKSSEVNWKAGEVSRVWAVCD
ncbi:hypothetical protein M407DRAFT_236226 [Tulasnella calospora MUT 4182]|uniref:Uncharacterized protein n=1 Tax=Tulasnella calospora MUT 4182 TaxID=1051891 RepID=A0A0C3L1X1_9AGAM|nr:hypothetical protein M407DRAFT_236226 [Tulasnella calospora MUT 4182]